MVLSSPTRLFCGRTIPVPWGPCPWFPGRFRFLPSRTEDIIAPLIGAPVSGSNLYSSFTVNFSTAPYGFRQLFCAFHLGGEYVPLPGVCHGYQRRVPAGNRQQRVRDDQSFPAGFGHGHELYGGHPVCHRWRCFHALDKPGIGNGYQRDSSDGGSVLAISSYSFREDTGIGTMTVDDLRVGLAFTDVVVASNPPPMVSLSASISGGTFQVAWTTNNTTAATLQSNTNLTTTNWNTVGQTPSVSGTNYVVTIPNPPGRSFYRLKF